VAALLLAPLLYFFFGFFPDRALARRDGRVTR
jgi:hypothetical protein